MASKRFVIGSGVFCVLFWLMFGFIVGSIRMVDLLNYGLVVDMNSVTVRTDRLYQPGRYFLGVRKSFLEFPSIQQILIFSNSLSIEKLTLQGAKFDEAATFFPTINARSQEGLSVSFDVVVYFKLGLPNNKIPLAEQLLMIYNDFADNWNDIVKRVTTFEMRNIAAENKVLDYFQKRKELGEDFRDALKASLEEFFIELKAVSIVNIKIPTTLEDAISDTEIVKQQVLTWNYTKQAKQIEANTRVLEAQKDANITIEIATADSQISLITKTAAANATTIMLQKQKEAFRQVAVSAPPANHVIDYTID